MTITRLSLVVPAVLIILGVPVAFALNDLPPNDGFVTDTAHILSTEEEQALEKRLLDYSNATSNQIAVVTIPSLNGDSLEELSLRIARTWGIGSAKHDNGILLLIAYEDRKVRIEVGYGLEGAVPDLLAKAIIDHEITPAFRKGEYASGVSRAIDALQKAMKHELTIDEYRTTDRYEIVFQVLLVFIFLFLTAGASFLSRSKSWWPGGVIGMIPGAVFWIAYQWWPVMLIFVGTGLFIDYLFSKYPSMATFTERASRRSFFYGGGSGSRSSGGGGGFGGGHFGGGGASGSW